MSLMDQNILSERNKQDMEKVKKIIADNNMKWTWESIYNVVFIEETDWDTLRFYDGKLHNIIVLIMAGLNEADRSKEKAFDILTQASEQGISPQRLHKFLYEVLQERHFFMDTPEMEAMQNMIEADNQDMVVLQNLMSSLIWKIASQETLQEVKGLTGSAENNSTKQ